MPGKGRILRVCAMCVYCVCVCVCVCVWSVSVKKYKIVLIVFFFFAQDLKCFVFATCQMHFKIKPI